MKRRIFFSLLLFAALLSLGASKKQSDELKRMSIFISNFTEQNMSNFDMDEDGDNGFMHLGDPEYADILLHFGIIHNIINNPKSTVKPCPDKKCPYGKNIMSGQAVTASIKDTSACPSRTENYPKATTTMVYTMMAKTTISTPQHSGEILMMSTTLMFRRHTPKGT